MLKKYYSYLCGVLCLLSCVSFDSCKNETEDLLDEEIGISSQVETFEELGNTQSNKNGLKSTSTTWKSYLKKAFSVSDKWIEDLYVKVLDPTASAPLTYKGLLRLNVNLNGGNADANKIYLYAKLAGSDSNNALSLIGGFSTTDYAGCKNLTDAEASNVCTAPFKPLGRNVDDGMWQNLNYGSPSMYSTFLVGVHRKTAPNILVLKCLKVQGVAVLAFDADTPDDIIPATYTDGNGHTYSKVGADLNDSENTRSKPSWLEPSNGKVLRSLVKTYQRTAWKIYMYTR